METLNHGETSEKDLPLRYDIRLLGRILGDTVRAQEGDAVFELVEHIRRTGVQFHRDADEAARQELQTIMSGLPTDQALRIIRAFGYFSHLANLAEDQHHIRRTRAYAMAKAPPRQGTMAYALDRARNAGISRGQLQAFFAHALCSPVLTAHPTEVRRKSSIDREMEIAQLLDERDRVAVHAGRAGGQPQGAAPRRAHPVADQPGARQAPQGHRRGRQRSGLLRPHLPARAARLLRRPGGSPRRHRSGLARPRRAVLPAHGELDRRRPRRQSLRHGRRDGAGARHAKPAGAALLSRGAASARRRIAARWPHRARLRGLARAGGALAGPFVGTPGRALPARHRRHLREAGCHRLVARQARSAASARRAGASL